jgi:hypothetical protein
MTYLRLDFETSETKKITLFGYFLAIAQVRVIQESSLLRSLSILIKLNLRLLFGVRVNKSLVFCVEFCIALFVLVLFLFLSMSFVGVWRLLNSHWY